MVETHAGRVFFVLYAAGEFTHSLARPRLCVVETQGALCFWRVRGCVWLKHMQGAFFLFCTRRGKFTHSLVRPRLCVVETQGAFFCSVRGGFFVLYAAGEIHSLTGASAKPRGCKKSRGQEAQKPKNQEAKEAEAEKPEGQKLKKPRSQGNQEAMQDPKAIYSKPRGCKKSRGQEAQKPKNQEAEEAEVSQVTATHRLDRLVNLCR